MSSHSDLNEFCDGQVRFWIDQESSIHLKAVTLQGDPVELTAAEAERLATALLAVAQKLARL
jgi:hypothetical protein